MNKGIKDLWVAALRSGDYKQTKYQLRYGNSFCCLGVLCNLHAQAHPEIAALETDPGMYMGECENLPPEVTRWAGISVHVPTNDDQLNVATLNDDGDAPFDDIADVIERQWERM